MEIVRYVKCQLHDRADEQDTPDTPDSADGQPEIPEIPEIPQDPVDGSYYWQCLKIPKEKGLIWV
jgi:hypothetical protein